MNAKEATRIATAGGHNFVILGNTGSGKTRLMNTILENRPESVQFFNFQQSSLLKCRDIALIDDINIISPWRRQTILSIMGLKYSPQIGLGCRYCRCGFFNFPNRNCICNRQDLERHNKIVTEIKTKVNLIISLGNDEDIDSSWVFPKLTFFDILPTDNEIDDRIVSLISKLGKRYAYNTILIADTIAKLDGKDIIELNDVDEAAQIASY